MRRAQARPPGARRGLGSSKGHLRLQRGLRGVVRCHHGLCNDPRSGDNVERIGDVHRRRRRLDHHRVEGAARLDARKPRRGRTAPAPRRGRPRGRVGGAAVAEHPATGKPSSCRPSTGRGPRASRRPSSTSCGWRRSPLAARLDRAHLGRAFDGAPRGAWPERRTIATMRSAEVRGRPARRGWRGATIGARPSSRPVRRMIAASRGDGGRSGRRRPRCARGAPVVDGGDVDGASGKVGGHRRVSSGAGHSSPRAWWPSRTRTRRPPRWGAVSRRVLGEVDAGVVVRGVEPREPRRRRGVEHHHAGVVGLVALVQHTPSVTRCSGQVWSQRVQRSRSASSSPGVRGPRRRGVGAAGSAEASGGGPLARGSGSPRRCRSPCQCAERAPRPAAVGDEATLRPAQSTASRRVEC